MAKTGEILITADTRERGSGVLEFLEASPGVRVEVAQLPVADFLLGGGVAVERKTARDLISSIIDRRLFEQAEHLRANYTHPVLILEGDPLAVPSRVRPNAIRGALARLAVTGRLPVLPSADPEGTAALLVTLARQAQVEGGQERSPAKRRALSVTEWQEALVAGLPGVGPVLARRLLAHLGSFAALVQADAQRLREVEGIGPRRAQTLVGLFSARYLPHEDEHGLASTQEEGWGPS
jgi:Fanconi anemia group M protein